ncbi:MAG: phenylacetate--CoA ligase [Nitrososphaerota archaeon]|jgi:phenylacetate-CoA ligase|nr:phenylacetate--CoA ligase [Nitrososphaerota archaeon]
MVDGKYWDEEIETLSCEEIRKIQLQKLREQVEYCYNNSVFYRKKFDSIGLKPDDIQTLEDLKKIPFTVKADLKENYPYGMVAASSGEIVEIHASSGTTGNPIVGVYTKHDIAVWQELMARSIYAAGGRPQDVIHVAYSYGLFTGGFGFHYGAQKVGARIVPASGGMTQRQVKLMKDLDVTILACTPSFAVHIAEVMQQEGVNPKHDLKLKRGIFGAEPWSQQMRQRIENVLGIETFDIYGLTELFGPGVSIECTEHNGLHVWEDHFIVEVIDSNTGEPLPDGQEGELVFTALSKTGLPILRYRTFDISKIIREKCACGRTHARMLRVTGRTDDMLIVRGVNVFPSQIEYAILQFPELAPQYLIVLDRPGALDTFHIKVELTEQAQADANLDLKQLKQHIQHKIYIITGLSAEIELVKPNEIPRSDGKTKRVLDLRKGKM